MPAPKPAQPLVLDEPHAPVIYFDAAPTAHQRDGIVGVTLSAALYLPIAVGQAQGDHRAVAYLRTSLAGARRLVESLQGTLLAAQKAETEARN